MDIYQVRTCHSPAQNSSDSHFFKYKGGPSHGLLDPVPPGHRCFYRLTFHLLPFHRVAGAWLFLEHINTLPPPDFSHLFPQHKFLPSPWLIASLSSGFYSNASLSEGPFLATTNKRTHLPFSWLQHPFSSLLAFIFLILLPRSNVYLFVYSLYAPSCKLEMQGRRYA